MVFVDEFNEDDDDDDASSIMVRTKSLEYIDPLVFSKRKQDVGDDEEA